MALPELLSQLLAGVRLLRITSTARLRSRRLLQLRRIIGPIGRAIAPCGLARGIFIDRIVINMSRLAASISGKRFASTAVTVRTRHRWVRPTHTPLPLQSHRIKRPRPQITRELGSARIKPPCHRNIRRLSAHTTELTAFRDFPKPRNLRQWIRARSGANAQAPALRT